MMSEKKTTAKGKRLSLSKKDAAELYGNVSRELATLYPDHECALEYGGHPWRLVVMARLSAQCTDARVNIVCRDLFEKYPTAEALAEMTGTIPYEILCGVGERVPRFYLSGGQVLHIKDNIIEGE